MRIMLVEDDDDIATAVTEALKGAGYQVDRVADGETAWFQGDTESYSAVVLDLGLPKLDGLTVLKRWRAAENHVPVLILTARGEWAERVEGIDAGADDYLPKPFQVEELLARLRAILRRQVGQSASTMSVGALDLDIKQMQISLDGNILPLSVQEYRLLSYLMQNSGRVVSQLELTEQLYAQDFERNSNAIEVLVGRVRRKLGRSLIETRRGFGYMIERENNKT